jgi:hypothetical protein
MAKKGDELDSQIGRVKAPVNRGTQDELEILRLIVSTTPTVRTLVMDKLRSAKSRIVNREATRGAVEKRRPE